MAATGLLSLGRDELGLLLEHVDAPFMLKLACTATRDAAPTATKTPRSAVVARVPLLQWARANGCPWCSVLFGDPQVASFEKPYQWHTTRNAALP